MASQISYSQSDTASDPASTHGWRGATHCSNLAVAWSCVNADDTEVRFSDMMISTARHLDKVVSMQIEAALQLNQPKLSVKRQGGRSAPGLADALQLPDIAAYASEVGRARLGSVLRAFTCWKPSVGYNEALASLAASLMAVIGNERHAFQCMTQIYQRYRLDDYFAPQTGPAGEAASAVEKDAQMILQAAKMDWPDLVFAFVKHDSVHMLLKLAQHLLSTLLTASYCPSKQSFKIYVRLLHHIVVRPTEYLQEDPRRQLRHVVLCIFVRNQNTFLRCQNASELQEVVARIQQHVLVDCPLLKTIMWQEQTETYKLAANLAAPVGVFLGGFMSYANVACHGLVLGSSVLHVLQGAAITGGFALSSGTALRNVAQRWYEECSHDMKQAFLLELEREDGG